MPKYKRILLKISGEALKGKEDIYDDLKIINCYEVYNTNTMLYNILDEHDYVFNTAGFNDKTDIFPGYIDKKKALKEAIKQ